MGVTFSTLVVGPEGLSGFRALGGGGVPGERVADVLKGVQKVA